MDGLKKEAMAESLRDLIKNMYELMAEQKKGGEGAPDLSALEGQPSEDGEAASVAEESGEKKLEDMASDEDKAPEEEGGLKDDIASFMRRGTSISEAPKKGTAVMMSVKMKKPMPPKFASKKK